MAINTRENTGAKRFKWVHLLACIALILAALAAIKALTMMQATAGAVSRAVHAVEAPPEHMEVTREAMVQALQPKLDITTFSMHLDKYVRGGICDGNAWQRFAWRDCITELVPAKINAGFNWGTFGPDRIVATHDQIIVNIGSPQVQDVVIDHAHIKVNGEDLGFFTSSNMELPPRLLAQTNQALRADACHNSILTYAADSAKNKIGGMLRALLSAAGDVRTVKVVSDVPSCS